tara:strand:+ start:359 stop:676 length:318 start_codon:yes stop_codon:yes gene_type:complete
MGRKRRERYIYDNEETTTPKEDRQDFKEEKKEDKYEAKDNKYQYKVAKVDAKANKALATAEKRKSLASLIKWLLIAAGAIYFAVQSKGCSFGGDWLNKIVETTKG